MSDPNLSTPSPRAPRRRGRGLRIALVLSLAVNLLVIGVVAGGAWKMRNFDGGRPPHGQVDIRALWQAMPRDARSALRERNREDGLHPDRPSREERRARMAELNAQLIEALRREPFDAEAFATLMQGDRAALERRLAAANAAFAAQLAGLSPAQRQALAGELEEEWEDRLPRR